MEREKKVLTVDELLVQTNALAEVNLLDYFNTYSFSDLMVNLPDLVLILFGTYLMFANAYDALGFKSETPNFGDYLPYIWGLIINDIVLLAYFGKDFNTVAMLYVVYISLTFYSFWVWRITRIGWDERRRRCYFEI